MKEKRAWDLSISPAKSLPMQAFMLYMSGGGVQIFSMGIVFMLLLSPFKNLAAINNGVSLHSSNCVSSAKIFFCVRLSSLRAVSTCSGRQKASTTTQGSYNARSTEGRVSVV